MEFSGERSESAATKNYMISVYLPSGLKLGRQVRRVVHSFVLSIGSDSGCVRSIRFEDRGPPGLYPSPPGFGLFRGRGDRCVWSDTASEPAPSRPIPQDATSRAIAGRAPSRVRRRFSLAGRQYRGARDDRIEARFHPCEVRTIDALGAKPEEHEPADQRGNAWRCAQDPDPHLVGAVGPQAARAA